MATPSKSRENALGPTPEPDGRAAADSSAESESNAALTHAALDIGAHLRSIRSAYGLSQRELAKRSGVTNGSISLIEQNSVSPTIALLRKVLAGFPMTLAEFFAGEVPRPPRIFFRAADLVSMRAGHLLHLKHVGPTGRKSRIQVLHEHYAPGGDTGEELLAHEGEEAGVIVRGRIEVTVGAATEVLNAGDAYAFDSRTPHRFRNIGSVPVEIVSACTPPTF